VSSVRADTRTMPSGSTTLLKRLLKNDLFLREYPDQYAYPPKSFIKPNSAKEFNAYA
jgi:hypothetical protein